MSLEWFLNRSAEKKQLDLVMITGYLISVKQPQNKLVLLN